MQVDSMLPNSKFPVMLVPVAAYSAEAGEAGAEGAEGGTEGTERAERAEGTDAAEGAEGCLHMTLTHSHTYKDVVALHYVGAALQPLKLQLEQNTVARLLRLCDALHLEAQPLLLETETRRGPGRRRRGGRAAGGGGARAAASRALPEGGAAAPGERAGERADGHGVRRGRAARVAPDQLTRGARTPPGVTARLEPDQPVATPTRPAAF